MRIARGDLATRIDLRRDDTSSLLFSLREMRDQLAATVARIKNSAETITVASKEIAAGNLDLSSRTEEQAASLQQTAASMDELTKTVTQNAGNAALRPNWRRTHRVSPRAAAKSSTTSFRKWPVSRTVHARSARSSA